MVAVVVASCRRIEMVTHRGRRTECPIFWRHLGLAAGDFARTSLSESFPHSGLFGPRRLSSRWCWLSPNGLSGLADYVTPRIDPPDRVAQPKTRNADRQFRRCRRARRSEEIIMLRSRSAQGLPALSAEARSPFLRTAFQSGQRSLLATSRRTNPRPSSPPTAPGKTTVTSTWSAARPKATSGSDQFPRGQGLDQE